MRVFSQEILAAVLVVLVLLDTLGSQTVQASANNAGLVHSMGQEVSLLVQAAQRDALLEPPATRNASCAPRGTSAMTKAPASATLALQGDFHSTLATSVAEHALQDGTAAWKALQNAPIAVQGHFWSPLVAIRVSFVNQVLLPRDQELYPATSAMLEVMHQALDLPLVSLAVPVISRTDRGGRIAQHLAQLEHLAALLGQFLA